MNTKKYEVAYQSVDPEGDVWCNELFLFENNESAQEFLSSAENIMKLLKLDLKEEDDEDGEAETYESVQQSVKILYTGTASGFYGVKFWCFEAGEILIVRASKGFVIS